MPTTARGSPGRDSAMRIMIIDDHEISRAAIRALLRAEGIDVIADFNTDGHALAAARALHPGEPFHEPFHDPPQRSLRSVTKRPANSAIRSG